MQLLRVFGRILLVIWAVFLAFGLGVETSRAAASMPDCAAICNAECSGDGGCQVFNQFECDCHWFCFGGNSGTSVCGR